MSTGTGRSRCTRRQTSSPSIPGSITSSTTRSGRTRWHSATPAAPSCATSTSKPSARSRAATAPAITCSSSITQISGTAMRPSVPARHGSRARIPCRFGAESPVMRLRLIRHATLLVETAGRRLLVDPMLDPAGARPPVANTPNQRRNPLVELPEPVELLARRLDGVVVTHLHADHLDETAVDLLPKDLPLLCQPADEGVLRDRGFTDVRPVEDGAELGALAIRSEEH